MKFIKKIKVKLCRFNLFNKLITIRSINIHKKKISAIEKKLKSKVRFYSPIDFWEIPDKKYDTCHIWGSGSSADLSKNLVKNKSNFFHIGFGFACLLNLNFKYYFIENASKNLIDTMTSQNKAIDYFLKKTKTKILFKNLWQDKNDIDFAIDHYSEKVFFIRDIIVPHYINSSKVLDYTIEKLFIHDPIYFRGACSTIINSIIFAKFLGFKKIVLHGVDFYGNYFFDEPKYQKKFPDMIPPYKKNIYNKKWRKQNSKHPSGDCLELILPKLKVFLKNQFDIELLSSIKDSGSSKYLNTFFND